MNTLPAVEEERVVTIQSTDNHNWGWPRGETPQVVRYLNALEKSRVFYFGLCRLLFARTLTVLLVFLSSSPSGCAPLLALARALCGGSSVCAAVAVAPVANA